MQILYESPSDVKIVQMTRPDEVEGLVTVFARIAAELSWQPGNQLSAWQDSALHLAVIMGGKVVGGLQAVASECAVDLPYRLVWPDVEMEGAAVHVTVMALEKEYRGPGLFWPLCVELWRWCDARGIKTILMEATPPTLRVYRRLGWPLEIVGGLRTHWGEDCYLCRAGVRQTEEAMVKRAEHSDAYRALVNQGYRDRQEMR